MKDSKQKNQQSEIPCVTYGYARVSSTDQNEDRQLISLRQAGVTDGNIFVDHKSGKDFNRPAWRRLIRKLHRGDILFITSLDRLGRNYEEMQEVWRKLTKRQGVRIRVLDMPLLNTSNHEGLTAEFLADLFLQVLAYVAQMEREHIRKRQREGIDAARIRGVKFGRPAITLPANFQAIVGKVARKEISLRAASRLCGFSTATFRRHQTKYVELSAMLK